MKLTPNIAVLRSAKKSKLRAEILGHVTAILYVRGKFSHVKPIEWYINPEDGFTYDDISTVTNNLTPTLLEIGNRAFPFKDLSSLNKKFVEVVT